MKECENSKNRSWLGLNKRIICNRNLQNNDVLSQPQMSTCNFLIPTNSVIRRKQGAKL